MSVNRKFGGKEYYLHSHHHSKRSAEKEATKMRNKGKLVRIAKTREGVSSGALVYGVWIH